VLPADRRARVASAAGVPASSEAVATVVRLELDGLVGAAVEAGADANLALRRLANEVAAQVDSDGYPDADAFVRLVKMEAAGELTPAQARDVLKVLMEEGGEPGAIAERLGYRALSAAALAEVVDQVVTANPREWDRYAGGDERLAGFFIGKVRAATGGSADLRAAAALLRERRSAELAGPGGAALEGKEPPR